MTEISLEVIFTPQQNKDDHKARCKSRYSFFSMLLHFHDELARALSRITVRLRSRIFLDGDSTTMVSGSRHDNTLMPRNPDGMHRPTTPLDGEGREPRRRQGRRGAMTQTGEGGKFDRPSMHWYEIGVDAD